MDIFGGSLLATIIPFLFVLTIVVFFHELGHFAVARWCGVKVDTFSIGFGHKLFGWRDRKGTEWKVGWLPLGGYVKFAGDENAASLPDEEKLAEIPESEKAHYFHFKPVHQRAAVVAAGPVANFILAIVIFAVLFSVVGRTVATPVVDSVQPDTPAAAAGFQPGDRVVEIDGRDISSFEDMQRIVSVSGGSTLDFTVERGGTQVDLTATPEMRVVTDRFGNEHRMGMLGIVRNTGEGGVEHVRLGPLAAVGEGVDMTWFIVTQTFSYLGDIIVGSQPADQLGGPLRIAQVSGQVATLGFAALLNLTAMLSVSIGLLNLFPVPMLDGGHLLYYGVEAARGKPLGERAQEIGFRIGLALVMSLMVFVTWNDLTQLGVFDFVGRLFS